MTASVGFTCADRKHGIEVILMVNASRQRRSFRDEEDAKGEPKDVSGSIAILC